MNPQVKALALINTRVIFTALSMLVLLCAFLYVYFINSAIQKTAMREEVRHQKMEIQSETSELEVEYLSLQKEVSREFAMAQGFVDVEETVFVSLPQNKLSLNE